MITQSTPFYADDVQRSVEFIQRPDEWPRWPILPLKSRLVPLFRPGALAFMVSRVAPPFRVYKGTYMFRLLAEGAENLSVNDLIKGMPYSDYETVEELVREWVVD